MKITLYMDIWQGVVQSVITATAQPGKKLGDTTRYRIDLTIPDPNEPDADACVKSVTVENQAVVKDMMYWENRYHELMAKKGWRSPSDSKACFAASREVEQQIKMEKADENGTDSSRKSEGE